MITGSLPQATNRQSWSEVFELFDSETGAPQKISDVTAITFSVRRSSGERWYSTQTLTLSLGSGITLVNDADKNKFQVDVTVDQMRSLCAPETYEVGITMLLQGETVQLFDGIWPIADGVVS